MHPHSMLAGAGTVARQGHSYRLAACGVALPLGLALGLVLGAWASRTLDGHPMGSDAPAAGQCDTSAVTLALPGRIDPDSAGWNIGVSFPAAALQTSPVATGNGALGDPAAGLRSYEHFPPGWHKEAPAP
jgi:hypothetical protein